MPVMGLRAIGVGNDNGVSVQIVGCAILIKVAILFIKDGASGSGYYLHLVIVHFIKAERINWNIDTTVSIVSLCATVIVFKVTAGGIVVNAGAYSIEAAIV